MAAAAVRRRRCFPARKPTSCLLYTSPALRRRCLEDVGSFEPLLPLCAADGYEIVPKEPRLTRRKPLPNGDSLPLRLDWILLKGVTASESRMISTCLLYTSRCV